MFIVCCVMIVISSWFVVLLNIVFINYCFVYLFYRYIKESDGFFNIFLIFYFISLYVLIVDENEIYSEKFDNE